MSNAAPSIPPLYLAAMMTAPGLQLLASEPPRVDAGDERRRHAPPLASAVQTRIPLPIELAEELSNDVYLPTEFHRLSELQRTCYARWVGDGRTKNERQVRALLVCSVVRVLAG